MKKKVMSNKENSNLVMGPDTKTNWPTEHVSNPIQTPSLEFYEIEIKIPPINIANRRISVGLLGIREESYCSVDGV
jgi:hypothetical protein